MTLYCIFSVEVRLPRKLMLYDVPDSVREGFASRKDIFTILPVLAQVLIRLAVNFFPINETSLLAPIA